MRPVSTDCVAWSVAPRVGPSNRRLKTGADIPKGRGSLAAHAPDTHKARSKGWATSRRGVVCNLCAMLPTRQCRNTKNSPPPAIQCSSKLLWAFLISFLPHAVQIIPIRYDMLVQSCSRSTQSRTHYSEAQNCWRLGLAYFSCVESLRTSFSTFLINSRQSLLTSL